jgi:hypothetical protein
MNDLLLTPRVSHRKASRSPSPAQTGADRDSNSRTTCHRKLLCRPAQQHQTSCSMVQGQDVMQHTGCHTHTHMPAAVTPPQTIVSRPVQQQGQQLLSHSPLHGDFCASVIKANCHHGFLIRLAVAWMRTLYVTVQQKIFVLRVPSFCTSLHRSGCRSNYQLTALGLLPSAHAPQAFICKSTQYGERTLQVSASAYYSIHSITPKLLALQSPHFLSRLMKNLLHIERQHSFTSKRTSCTQTSSFKQTP